MGLLFLFMIFPEGYQNVDDSKFFVCRGENTMDNYYIQKKYSHEYFSNGTVDTFIELHNLKDIDSIHNSPICEEVVEINDNNTYSSQFQEILEDVDGDKIINIENKISNIEPSKYKHYNDSDTILYSENMQKKILESKQLINGGSVDDRNHTVGHGYVDKSHVIPI